MSGKPTARRAQFPGGNRMTGAKCRQPKGSGKPGHDGPAPPDWLSWITGRISGLVPGRESALTRSGEPVRRKMTEAREPEDKLDATATVVVNGPEDAAFDWHATTGGRG